MNRSERLSHRCKRCNKPAGADMICQSCKGELLANYEAASDWQTAFEIERAAQTALRYKDDDEEIENTLYF